MTLPIVFLISRPDTYAKFAVSKGYKIDSTALKRSFQTGIYLHQYRTVLTQHLLNNGFEVHDMELPRPHNPLNTQNSLERGGLRSPNILLAEYYLDHQTILQNEPNHSSVIVL